MELDELREFCLRRDHATEEFPFGDDTLVFKVGGKMFCLLSLEPPHSINLKCEPEKVILLREENEDILPGYHMNKKHWITVNLSGSLTNKFIFSLVSNSYDLVYAKLPEKIKKEWKIR